MKCAQCQQAGLKSTISVGACFSTDMSVQIFYDEDGEYHRHDMNSRTTGYRCSNGHAFSKARYDPCPAAGCDFNKE